MSFSGRVPQGPRTRVSPVPSRGTSRRFRSTIHTRRKARFGVRELAPALLRPCLLGRPAPQFFGGLALSGAVAQPGCPVPMRREQAPVEIKAGASSRTPKCHDAQAIVQILGCCFATWMEIPNEEYEIQFAFTCLVVEGTRSAVDDERPTKTWGFLTQRLRKWTRV
jgi:hypothetical protein